MGIGKEAFIAGATLATFSAPIIATPGAFALAALCWSLMANPDTMNEAKEKWHTTAELKALQASVKDLSAKLGDVAKWEGGTAEIVQQTLDQFVTETNELGEHRKGVGDVLGSSATLYNVMSGVVFLVGAWMAKMAVASLASNATPITAAAYKTAAIAGTKAVWVSLKAMRSKLLLFVAAAGGIYAGVQALTATQTMKFQDMKAGMRYQNLKLTNEPNTGALTPDTTMSA